MYSAVASSVVKQKLQEVILKKQKQAALERTTCNPLSSPPVGYRELAPDPSAPPQSLMVASPPQPPSDSPEEPPLRRAECFLRDVTTSFSAAAFEMSFLRSECEPKLAKPVEGRGGGCTRSHLLPSCRTASEPNLKVRNKLKNHLNTRKSPLTRKESAPPSIKHRVPDPMDTSPSSSSTPVSGCSSPNDSLPTENGVLPSSAVLPHEDGTVAHFTVQSPSTLPTITLGLPANGKNSADVASMKMTRVPVLTPQVYLPLDLKDQGGPLSPCLQPVLIVEPSGLVRTPLLT
ncbi:hypothetical protein Z043_123700, partial [Scleropages formosus]